jgi:diguanylate cyclase (GGDEF)-like protein
MNAARDRERLAALRARAATQREMAARDREHAAEDRRQAALDRKAAAEELARQGIDHLTGTMRRQAGVAAMQREVDRTARTHDRLVAAFIDVDGLKAVNDDKGHAAGDELLQAVARCVKEQLRSYDLIARYGGDEFVCTISGYEIDGVRERFEVINEQLSLVLPGATISVGLAEREPDEPLKHLIDRADAVLRSSKKSRRS